jgi:CheY-like chemotaxis protein
MSGARPDVGEEYLSQVAHELRGSLNAILGWAEFLRAGPCDEAARVRAAETIIRHARQQSGMLGELFDTWRLAAGTLKLNVTTFDLRQVVSSAVDAVQPAARNRSVRLECHDDSPAGTTVRARGDVKRLAQALAAVLANAVHFAPEQTTVHVRLETGGGIARLTVRDNGPGVPPGLLPFLFERNRPPDRATPRGNFRLGLSFAREVMTRHRGSIEGESAGESAGMIFRLRLPLEEAAGPAAGHALVTEPSSVEMATSELGGLRVLLVDDEPDARDALGGILQLHGAVVHAAGSAADAIARLQHEAYDVLLADIGMPGADGYDLIRYVRALEDESSHMPAAAVTAFASDADRRRALDAGFQVHLSKPVDPAALVATVAVLGRPRAGAR